MKRAILLTGVVVMAVVLGACSNAGQGQSESESGHSSHRESPALRHPEVSGRRVAVREALSAPLQAYNFHLRDQYGAPVSLDSLSGRVVLVSFVYTNCPEACPLVTASYLELQAEFAQPVNEGRLSLVLITTDPQRDTPERLRDYTTGRGGKWLFLSDDEDALKKAWDGYGIYREVWKELEEVVIYHSYKTFLIDQHGLLRYRYEGVWYPTQVAEDIRNVMGSEDGAVRPSS